MSSSFETMLAADAAALCGAEFGEPVTYTTAVGVATSISAVIDRSPPEVIDTQGNVSRPRMTALIPRLSITTRPTARDTVTVVYQAGSAPFAYAVLDVLKEDQGAWLVQL